MNRSVQAAWQTNLKVNLVLVDHLTPKMLDARTPGGGYTAAQHLAHLVGSVKYWGSRLDDARLGGLPDLTVHKNLSENDPDAFVTETDLKRIRTVFVETAEAARDAVKNTSEGFTGELPHASTDAFLIHMMVHDAHHRGQLLLALKTSGYALPDEDSLWTPWKEK